MPKARSQQDVYSFVPDERLDVRSPRIYCKSIMTHDQLYGWLDAMKPLHDIESHRRPGGGKFALDRVDHRSARSVRLAVEAMALYFKREFGYDFLQYGADDERDDRDRFYLLTETRHDCHLAVGAICFRWREWTDGAPHGLALAWLWINPFLRRSGVLSAYWPALRAMHGDFLCETPLSHAMRAFLAKRGECWKCGRACSCSTAV